MDPWLVLYLLVFLAVLVAAAVGLRLLLPLVLAHFKGGTGGWSALAASYATAEEPAGELLRGRSIVAGAVLYRFCVTVGIAAPGLYLAAETPITPSPKPLLIPWGAFMRVEPARLFWRKAALISLGDPQVGTLTVPMELYTRMRRHLPETLASIGAD
jgi:hypothetical protein